MTRTGTLLPLALAGMILLLGSANAAHAQATCNDIDGVRTCVVDQGFGTLNEAVAGDTAATGERIDPNTVYVLQRDGLYLLNGSLDNAGFPLTIRADEGSGNRPIIQAGTDDTGASSRLINARGDLFLEGLYLTHVDQVGALKKNMIRIFADEARIVVNDCYFDYEQQSFFRYSAKLASVFVTNSVFRNAGQATNPGNGRIIDTRGNEADSIYFENNVVHNITNEAFLPGFGAGGTVNYLWWNHNTMVNLGNSAVGIKRSKEAYVINNIILNPGFLGDPFETDSLGNSLGQLFTEGVFEVDTLGVPDMTEEQRTLIIANNNIYWEPDLVSTLQNDPNVEAFQLYSPNAQAFIDAGIVQAFDNTSEAVPFGTAPASILAYVQDRLNNPDNDAPPPFVDDADEPYSGDFENQGPGRSAFSYPTALASYTAAVGGFPLGDLNWFPAEMADWIANNTDVSVSTTLAAEVPATFRLLGNFPNPFNPNTTIMYDLAAPSQVRIEVFNLLGQRVRFLLDAIQPAGRHELIFDAAGLPSGIYLTRMSAEGTMQTRQMVLIK